jgi:uncharacterized protein (DUF427 family)
MTKTSESLEFFAQARKGSIEPSERWVRVKLDEETVADSKNSLLLIQFAPGVTPTYFFTADEVAMNHLLSPVERDGKRYWSLRIGDRQIEAAAWTYVDPPEHLAPLKDRLTFAWTALDWYEEDEPVFVHARDPHQRVDVLASSRHVQVLFANEIVADTHRPVLLFETHLPTRFYIPPEDVRLAFLRESDLVTQCPYKGQARYWSLQVGDDVLENGVWSYADPIHDNKRFKNMLCFFNEKVDIFLDGEQIPNPLTPWS